ncbi:Asparaginase/glutaminase [Leptodontidium sp. 2 PMI_412]|nr:Asparaginase/glutaminase [Leptodontidium sp. 2 PMI_412]
MLCNTLAGAVLAFSALTRATSFDSGLEWISTNPFLPKAVAGGTILSASNYSRIDNINYGSGTAPTPADLIGNFTEVLNLAQLAIVRFATSGGSSGANSSLFLNITQHANRQLCAKDSDIAGAIMFHGTNTLEETAFGVDMTFNCSKPFIATGSMRPNTYMSPDGPSNFYQAVAAAASRSSRDRGGLVAFNDRITSIYYSTKLNANTPDTFKALEQGNLGAFLAGQPYYFFGPSYPTGRPHFNVANTTELPSVVILYGHQGFDHSLMHAAVANGANKGIPVVAVARPASGTGVPRPSIGSVFFSSYIGAEQARIVLQLGINAGYDMDLIRDLFEGPLRNAVYGPLANQEIYY